MQEPNPFHMAYPDERDKLLKEQGKKQKEEETEERKPKVIKVSYTPKDNVYWLDIEGRRGISVRGYIEHGLPQACEDIALNSLLINHFTLDTNLPFYKIEFQGEMPLDEYAKKTLEALVELHNKGVQLKDVLEDLKKIGQKYRNIGE
ncbi:hypothetical protein HYX16_03920 [Candidatus Woesearchaeota archaeon]|nr:hypothetical protein [Candidatus Woesearchaeota archaeon]